MAVINMEMSFTKFFSSYRKHCYAVKGLPAVFIENAFELQQKK